MSKYYVAGIPFDSENSLKHYGVKNMEWGKHKFGIDADDRYIKWLKNAGQNIGRFANNAAQNVAKGATTAARTVGSAVNKGANFVTGAANQAGKTASGAFNNAKNWAGKTARNIGNTVSDVADQAGKAVGNAANAAGNWAGQTAQNVGNFVTGDQTRKDLQDAQNSFIIGRQGRVNAAQDAYNQTLPGMLENTGKAAQNIVSGAKGYINSAGKWVSTAANNVGNTVGNAVNDAKNFAGQTARNVGNAFTGNIDRNTANSYRQLADFQADPNAPFHAESPQYDPENLRRKANEYDKAADKALFPTIGRVTNAIGDVANNVGNAVSNAAQAVTNTPQNIANWYTGNDVRQEAERQRELGNMNRRYGTNLMDLARNGKWDDEANRLGAWDEGMNKYLEGGSQLRSADRYMDMYDNAPRQKIASGIQSAMNTVGNAASGVADAVGNAASGTADAVRGWVGDRVTDAKNAITAPVRNDLSARRDRAVDDAFNIGMQDYRDTGDTRYFPYDSRSPAGQEINQIWDQYNRERKEIDQHPISSALGYAAQNIGNGVSNAAGAVRDWAGNAAQNVGNAVSEMMNPRIPEQRIEEQRIPEQRIEEQRIPEQKITENRITAFGPSRESIAYERNNKPDDVSDDFWNYYTFNGGTRANFDARDRQSLFANKPAGVSDAYWYMILRGEIDPTRIYHSALSNEKPDGVSDAFWAKFTADGGTREDYERDWR